MSDMICVPSDTYDRLLGLLEKLARCNRESIESGKTPKVTREWLYEADDLNTEFGEWR